MGSKARLDTVTAHIIPHAGTVVFVTGGASGLGKAVVEFFVAAGASRIVAFDLNEPADDERVSSDVVKYVAGDVTSEEDVTRALDAAPGVRVVVNCAGIATAQRTVDRSGEPHGLAPFTTVMQVNVVGTFNVIRLAAPRMGKNAPDVAGSRGVFINTASVAAFDGQAGQVAYAASKGAVVSMTLPIARDLSPLAIRCVTVAPGTFDTPMFAALPAKAVAALAAAVPFPKRLGKPAEFAQLVGHIAANPMLNGETIRLDGGLRMV